jgi:DNA-binding NarL/FixJ family response regulator
MLERLTDLIYKSGILCDTCGDASASYCAEAIAEHLIQNGVDVPVKNPKVVWTGLSERQREVVKAFSDCNMNATVTAKRTFTNRNNIYYHIREIRRKTGLNPRCFKDLKKLLSIIEKGIE